MRSYFLSGIAILATKGVSAQFVSPPTDLKTAKGYLDLPVRYKQVPEGICELTPGVKSYSGYVDIEQDQHSFFWFFEARNGNPKDAPLTVWINGGPGSSSMLGLFQENGPCRLDADGNPYSNPYAWNNVSNMIFIDQPTQTGFSYSKAISGYTTAAGSIVQLPNATCPDYAENCATYSAPIFADTANSTAAAAPAMWKTLQGFMGAFPQYSRKEFAFATESFGGHYGPIFNEYIKTQNEKIRHGELHGAHHIDLKTVLIGNGWYDPLIQYAAFYNFSLENTYDLKFFNDSIQTMMYQNMYGTGNCYDQTVNCYKNGIDDACAAADSFCYDTVEAVLDRYTGRDEYDIREFSTDANPDPFPPTFFEAYLNTPKVQQAIGAFVNFTGATTVGTAFAATGDDDREDGTIEALSKLVEQGVYVIMYFGDADYICNWIGGEVVAEKVNAPDYCNAGYVNITTSDDIVHGQVKQAGHFAFARIYESGHEVPFYQPVIALEMFERALQGRDIATGKHSVWRSGYKTVGSVKSTYREGNGTVQFEPVDASATYNTTTNQPNPVVNGTASGQEKKREVLFRPNRK
ncbi:Carboxypeptidase S1-like B [Acrodontium crateriforme]|uniref:Carboxypeptidase S1-like B n=1 Tax=Acrodontium crateriforme TaxID=150365 RepID=A0AAQ3RDX9_9PEZI|nr:Carboxypeptidase S1-like B [Acrodontium crateriforme]